MNLFTEVNNQLHPCTQSPICASKWPIKHFDMNMKLEEWLVGSALFRGLDQGVSQFAE